MRMRDAKRPEIQRTERGSL